MANDAIIRFDTKKILSTIQRPNNTTAYTAGDVIAAVTTDAHFVFEEFFDVRRSRSGLVSSAFIISSANQSTKLDAELFLFAQDITEVGDNVAFAPTDAEMAHCIGVIYFDTDAWKAGNATAGAGGNAICFSTIQNGGLPLKGYGATMYGVLVARNAYTPVANEQFTIGLLVSQDG